MPYESVDAEVFMEHRGIKIYFIYRDDLIESSTYDYIFSWVPWADSELTEWTFDVRDLVDDLQECGVPFDIKKGDDEWKKSVICEALERGLIDIPEAPDHTVNLNLMSVENWDRELRRRENETRFLAENTGCPNCGQDGNLTRDPVVIDGKRAYQNMHCRTCGFEGKMCYRFSHISESYHSI